MVVEENVKKVVQKGKHTEINEITSKNENSLLFVDISKTFTIRMSTNMYTYVIFSNGCKEYRRKVVQKEKRTTINKNYPHHIKENRFLLVCIFKSFGVHYVCLQIYAIFSNG